jgi:hypothetical protein
MGAMDVSRPSRLSTSPRTKFPATDKPDEQRPQNASRLSRQAFRAGVRRRAVGFARKSRSFFHQDRHTDSPPFQGQEFFRASLSQGGCQLSLGTHPRKSKVARDFGPVLGVAAFAYVKLATRDRGRVVILSWHHGSRKGTLPSPQGSDGPPEELTGREGCEGPAAGREDGNLANGKGLDRGATCVRPDPEPYSCEDRGQLLGAN